MPAFRFAAAPALRAPSRISNMRSFQSASVLRASKETAPADENRKQEIDREKREQLKEQKEGKNEWKQTLASESESVVKADRGEIQASKSTTIQDLQKESARAAQEEKKK